MSGNPIFNDNKLKIGTFCSNGWASTQSVAPEVNNMTWPISVEAAQMADAAGLEAVVPFARWLGYIEDKPQHYSTDVMEPYIWAAGLAQATKRIGIFVTSHAPTIHPLLAAKQTAMIDVISNGRLGFNIVAGWNRHELEMFGDPLDTLSRRYDYLAEWLDVIKKTWMLDEAFNLDGEFFTIKGGFTLPKPIQKPRPPIMNAGGSERGMRFACEHADMCFVTIKSGDPEQIKADVAAYKTMAREQFGREVMVWTNCVIVQRDTQKEAEDFFQYYAVEMEDTEAIDAWLAGREAGSESMSPEMLKSMRSRFAAGGGGGFPIVGDAERITDTLRMISDCGIDGVLVAWGDFIDGISRLSGGVLPLLEQEGLRKPLPGGQSSLGIDGADQFIAEERA